MTDNWSKNDPTDSKMSQNVRNHHNNCQNDCGPDNNRMRGPDDDY